MKIILAFLVALGIIDLCVIIAFMIYTTFFGDIYFDIDIRNKNNDNT